VTVERLLLLPWLGAAELLKRLNADILSYKRMICCAAELPGCSPDILSYERMICCAAELPGCSRRAHAAEIILS
tara:strand:+ start:1144 stop:1365 length:222 start_codon:yes stop_codon:yes gene_type:complete